MKTTLYYHVLYSFYVKNNNSGWIMSQYKLALSTEIHAIGASRTNKIYSPGEPKMTTKLSKGWRMSH